MSASRVVRHSRHQDSPVQITSDDTEEDDYHDEDDDDDAIGMPIRGGNDHAGEDDRQINQEEEDDDDEMDAEATADATVPPPGLKEISSLASWTVSTSKPGCGVAALRSPDTQLFWQSDGPQPHHLSIHFFKLVSIVHMRIFLDFENDESYTPTKMQFWAGMGVHDLQQFAEMTFEGPKGWINVDFSNVGPITNDEDGDDRPNGQDVDWDTRPVLRAFLVQVRIIENHQNGKDTHLRGLQIFARDHSVTTTISRPAVSESAMPLRTKPNGTKQRSEMHRPKKASWMMDPEIR